MLVRSLLPWVVFGLAPAAPGHGPLHERIQRLGEQIELSPRNPGLHVERGLLHHAHEDWKAAVADFDRAAVLDPDREEVWLHRGASLLALGDAKAAVGSLDRFLAARPNHAEARLVRAKARCALRLWEAAVEDFDRALPKLGRPRPEPWLARAAAHREIAPDGSRRALAGLAQAAAELGPLVVFDELALEIERELRDHEAALARLDRLIECSKRDERWWCTRGDVLREADRLDEAVASWRRGLEALESLPRRIRNTRAMRQLRVELERRLDPTKRGDGP